MPTLVLLRHGESTWNQENRFTGWVDVDLSLKGRGQAEEAGRILHRHGLRFDVAYTSVLKRAIRTLWIVLDEIDLMWIPTHACWRLNERHYGALQGLNKAETAAKFGAGQVKLWRRSYDVRPPQIANDDRGYPGRDPRYRHICPAALPLGESLKDTASRLWPCWQHSIAPALRRHEKVLVVAHGNNLRALVKYLDGISDNDIADVEVPCGVPLIYELGPDLNRIGSYYLEGAETMRPTDCGNSHADRETGLSQPVAGPESHGY
ncbi:MAG TPA: 2,3-diphosphoglycerate-dependent phosphoglycerate mutase [Terriglobales bacterium]|jgi:2,3-bisphosphoglycerate-dependent phosphoglycerate mutase